MTVSDEMLSAFLDGELPAAEADAIRRALQSDPVLAARLECMKKLTPLIAQTYAAIDDEPLPDCVKTLLETGDDPPAAEPASNVVAFVRNRAPSLQTGWIAAMAASVALVIGVGVGVQLAPGADVAKGDALASVIGAGNPLYAALENASSARSVETALGKVTPILTFKSANGQYCREFLTEGEMANHRAVACRAGERWVTQIAVLAQPQTSSASSYSTASAGADMEINDFVDRIIDGDALSADEEAELLGRW